MHNQYIEQVGLLLKLLPFALEDSRLALKGGTAINLFFRDMPRLSVDIDLCYLPLENREDTLKNINDILNQMAQKIVNEIKGSVVAVNNQITDQAKQLIVQVGKITVKIEINLVIRGAVYEPQIYETSPRVFKIFNTEAAVNCLSLADVYGGKICACLSRQHPRDWYDVLLLLQNEGITDQINTAFIFYLLSSNRPIAEILDPQPLNQRHLFNNELLGMNGVMPGYADLSEVRVKLTKALFAAFTSDDKEFLLSFKEGAPKWEKINIVNLNNYPSIKWKMLNLSKMTEEKRKIAVKKLKEILLFQN